MDKMNADYQHAIDSDLIAETKSIENAEIHYFDLVEEKKQLEVSGSSSDSETFMLPAESKAAEDSKLATGSPTTREFKLTEDFKLAETVALGSESEHTQTSIFAIDPELSLEFELTKESKLLVESESDIASKLASEMESVVENEMCFLDWLEGQFKICGFMLLNNRSTSTLEFGKINKFREKIATSLKDEYEKERRLSIRKQKEQEEAENKLDVIGYKFAGLFKGPTRMFEGDDQHTGEDEKYYAISFPTYWSVRKDDPLVFKDIKGAIHAVEIYKNDGARFREFKTLEEAVKYATTPYSKDPFAFS